MFSYMLFKADLFVLLKGYHGYKGRSEEGMCEQEASD